MSIYWYFNNVQSCIVAFWIKITTNLLTFAPNHGQSYMDAVLVKIATNLLNFAPNYGLAWQVMGYNTYIYGREQGPKLRDPCT